MARLTAERLPLLKLMLLFRKYRASMWFTTDEAWDPHFVDSHYYHVSVPNEPEFAVPCKKFTMCPDGICFWFYCDPYIYYIDTEEDYFWHIRISKPTGKTAEFLYALAHILEQFNIMIEPSTITVDGERIRFARSPITYNLIKGLMDKPLWQSL